MPESRSYLFSLEQIGIKLGLEQINSLLDRLGRPELAFRSIIVAGTNGKGSTTAMIERGLRAAGYRTGRYTSPHLVHIEERVAVNGVPIEATVFDESAERVQIACQALDVPPTFFEATTALALDVFRQQAIDIAVLEVGLGGRLDATNAVPAVAAAITAVDFDHEAYLGHTIEAIAREKAGVIKPGQIVVLAGNPASVVDVVTKTCEIRKAALVKAWEGVSHQATRSGDRTMLELTTPVRHYGELRLGLRGQHQVENAVTAVRLLECLDDHGIVKVPAAGVRSAVEEVTWPARLELLETRRGQVLLDGAHNPAGARALAAYVRAEIGRPVPLVVGVMADKNVEEILLALAGFASHVVVTKPESPRAARPEHLADVLARVSPETPVTIHTPASAALDHALLLGSPVVVAGSLYLAGEIRDLL